MSGFDDGGMAPPPPPPPSAGGGGAIPPRGLGDILTTAFELYKTNAAQLIKIVAIVVVPLTFVLALLTQVAFKQNCTAPDNIQTLQDLQNFANDCSATIGRSLFIGALGWFIAVAIQQLILGAVTRGGAAAVLGRSVDVEGSYRYAFSRLGGLIVLALLIALAVFLGFFVFVVGALIVGVFFAVAVPAFIIERTGATDSMSRSWKLVRGHWWHTFGVILVAGILAGIVNGILTAIGGSNFFLYWILSAIAQSITAPFVALVAVILYIDLRSRHEGLTADQLGSQLDAAQA
jgi:hypothetical protein